LSRGRERIQGSLEILENGVRRSTESSMVGHSKKKTTKQPSRSFPHETKLVNGGGFSKETALPLNQDGVCKIRSRTNTREAPRVGKSLDSVAYLCRRQWARGKRAGKRSSGEGYCEWRRIGVFGKGGVGQQRATKKSLKHFMRASSQSGGRRRTKSNFGGRLGKEKMSTAMQGTSIAHSVL